MNHKSKASKSSKASTAVLLNIYTLIRLAISVILLILAYKISTTALISALILIVAFVVGGFNIMLSSYKAIVKKDYFSPYCLILVAAIASFAAGCYVESVVFAVIFELCNLFLDFALRLTKKNISDNLPKSDAEEVSSIKSLLNRYDTVENPYKTKLRPIFDLASKAALIAAVLYAVLLPILSDMTFVMSIRRGAMLLAAVAPASALASLSLCTASAIGYSASAGVYFDSPEVLEKASGIREVVFDKFDVITAGAPKIASIISPVMDNENFLKAIAYVAYRSEQRIASSIVAAYDGEIFPEYIQDFKDIPGYGMEVKIGGQPVLLGTMNLLNSRGISISDSSVRKGNVLYLIVSGKFAGSVIFNESINPYAAQSVEDLKSYGINSVLLSEDGSEICEKTANSIKITDFYPCCDTLKKLETISNIKQVVDEKDAVLYVSAESIDYHTEADLDARVGKMDDVCDLCMSNIGIYGLSTLVRLSKLSKRISAENIAAVLLVKLVSIILALTGSATLWFITLFDFAAGIFGVLNIVQMTKNQSL